MSAPVFQIIRNLATAEDRLARTLELAPVAIDETLACASGTSRGRPVAIQTRGYRGGAIAYARFTTMTADGLEIGNVLVLPAADYPLPIFGADWVSVTRDRAMLALDLSPSVPVEGPGTAHLDRLRAWRDEHGALPQEDALPAFCARFFSEHALFTRVGPERAAELAGALQSAADLFVELVREAEPRPDMRETVLDTIRAYDMAHREDDRSMAMLGHVFGAPWADRFLRTVMFPDAV